MDSSSANLVELLATDPSAGPLWAIESEDLDCTFVAWEGSKGVAVHCNAEVDVVMLVVSGQGTAMVGTETVNLSPGTVLLIPKGVERGVIANTRLAYLNIHKRRKRLMPGSLENRPR